MATRKRTLSITYIKEGFLFKKYDIIKWQKRFCVLNQDSFCYNKGEAKSMKSSSGRIFLSDIAAVELDPPAIKKPFVFGMRLQNDELVMFQAASKEDRESWYSCINKAKENESQKEREDPLRRTMKKLTTDLRRATLVKDESGGIGCFLAPDFEGHVVVETIVEDGPLSDGGALRVGDEILEIQDIPLKGKSIREILNIISRCPVDFPVTVRPVSSSQTSAVGIHHHHPASPRPLPKEPPPSPPPPIMATTTIAAAYTDPDHSPVPQIPPKNELSFQFIHSTSPPLLERHSDLNDPRSIQPADRAGGDGRMPSPSGSPQPPSLQPAATTRSRSPSPGPLRGSAGCHDNKSRVRVSPGRNSPLLGRRFIPDDHVYEEPSCKPSADHQAGKGKENSSKRHEIALDGPRGKQHIYEDPDYRSSQQQQLQQAVSNSQGGQEPRSGQKSEVRTQPPPPPPVSSPSPSPAVPPHTHSLREPPNHMYEELNKPSPSPSSSSISTTSASASSSDKKHVIVVEGPRRRSHVYEDPDYRGSGGEKPQKPSTMNRPTSPAPAPPPQVPRPQEHTYEDPKDATTAVASVGSGGVKDKRHVMVLDGPRGRQHVYEDPDYRKTATATAATTVNNSSNSSHQTSSPAPPLQSTPEPQHQPEQNHPHHPHHHHPHSATTTTTIGGGGEKVVTYSTAHQHVTIVEGPRGRQHVYEDPMPNCSHPSSSSLQQSNPTVVLRSGPRGRHHVYEDPDNAHDNRPNGNSPMRRDLPSSPSPDPATNQYEEIGLLQ